MFKNEIQKFIHKGSNYLLVLKINEEIFYSDYIKIISQLKDAVDELRDNFSMDYYSKHYSIDLPKEEKYIIEKEFPFILIEKHSALK